MNEPSNTTLKVITALAIGFAVNFSMALFAAPGSSDIALAVGVFLTSFGFIFAKFVMEIVLLPMAVVTLFVRLMSGKKMIARKHKSNDQLDSFGRVLFIVAYGFGSAITGMFVGAMEGAMGWFATSALFGTVGILLAKLMPSDLVWAAEGGESVSAEPTAAGKEDMEQARKDGSPSVLLADKIAKKVIDALVEKPMPNKKP